MSAKTVWNEAVKILKSGNETAIFRNITKNEISITNVENEKGCVLYKKENDECCYQSLCTKPCLVVYGAGHVAYYTAKIGNMLDFDVTVIDGRDDFANKERFPFANVLCESFETALKKVPRGTNTYFVIATRGHAQDTLCLESALKGEYGYVGMIGSRSKIGFVMDKMRNAGISEKKIKTVHTPIGLSIGGVTPAEIAVSIGAELVQVRSQKSQGVFVGDDVIESIAEGKAKAVATILSQKGSSPRGAGAVMTVNFDGKICGTVGGGDAESKTINECLNIEKGTQKIVDYDMNAKTAQELGMVCGGYVRILIESLEE